MNEPKTPLKLVIVTPVYNDWQSFQELGHSLVEVSSQWTIQHLIAVNDGSDASPENAKFDQSIPVTIINLNTNGNGYLKSIIDLKKNLYD